MEDFCEMLAHSVPERRADPDSPVFQARFVMGKGVEEVAVAL